VVYALDGLPVVWMGDELGLGDNQDVPPPTAGPADGRWRQRPLMDWGRAEQRRDRTRLAGRAFQALASYARLRATLPAFGADHLANPVPSGDPAILSFLRGEPSNQIQCLGNFSPEPRSGRLALQPSDGWSDLLGGDVGEGPVVPLGPYQVRWLTARASATRSSEKTP